MVDRADLSAYMNALPFVRWDRFVDHGSEGVVFGWIDRDDGRADFVVLNFEQRSDGIAIGYTTSSAKRTAEIGRVLYGDGNEAHTPCQRVDEHFGDLVYNKVAV